MTQPSKIGGPFSLKESAKTVGANHDFTKLPKEEEAQWKELDKKRENSKFYSHIVRALLKKFLGLERDNQVTQRLFKNELFLKFANALITDFAEQMGVDYAIAYKAFEGWLLKNEDFNVLVTSMIRRKVALNETIEVNISDEVMELLDQIFREIETIEKEVVK